MSIEHKIDTVADRRLSALARVQLLELGERVRAVCRALIASNATDYDTALILEACHIDSSKQPAFFLTAILRSSNDVEPARKG